MRGEDWKEEKGNKSSPFTVMICGVNVKEEEEVETDRDEVVEKPSSNQLYQNSRKKRRYKKQQVQLIEKEIEAENKVV